MGIFDNINSMKANKMELIAESNRGLVDVIFIHGLTSNPVDTWSSSNGEFWPKWLNEDLNEVSVYSLGYPSKFFNFQNVNMSVEDRAYNLLTTLKNYEHDGYALGNRPTIFITHSLGGILLKKMMQLTMIRDDKTMAAIADNSLLHVFLASPHGGSSLASILTALTIASAKTNFLSKNHPALYDLKLAYRDFYNKRDFEVLSFHETRKTKGAMTVDLNSTDPGVGDVRSIPIDANHSMITRLESREATVYQTIKQSIAVLIEELRNPEKRSRKIFDRVVKKQKQVSEIRERIFDDLIGIISDLDDKTVGKHKLKAAQAIIEYEPDQPWPWNFAGMTLFKNGSYEDAEFAFKQVDNLDPNFPNFREECTLLLWDKTEKVILNIEHREILDKEGLIADALRMATYGQIMAKNSDNAQRIAQFNRATGLIFFFKQDYQSAESHLIKALEYYRSVSKLDKCAEILVRLGNVHDGNGDPEKARPLYQEAKEIFESGKNLPNLIDVEAKLGIFAVKQANFDDAETGFLNARELATQTNDKIAQHRAAADLSILYSLTEETDKSRAFLEESINFLSSEKESSDLLFSAGLRARKYKAFEVAIQYLSAAYLGFNENCDTERSDVIDKEYYKDALKICRKYIRELGGKTPKV